MSQHKLTADEAMVEFSIRFRVVDADKATHKNAVPMDETHTFYYQPRTKQYREPSGSGAMAAMFGKVVKVSADGKTASILNGGHYADTEVELKVFEAILKGQPTDDGKVTVDLKVQFIRVPPNYKLQTADGTWGTPTPDKREDLRVALPGPGR